MAKVFWLILLCSANFLLGCSGVHDLIIDFPVVDDVEVQSDKGTLWLDPFRNTNLTDIENPTCIGVECNIIGISGDVWVIDKDIAEYVTDSFIKYLESQGVKAEFYNDSVLFSGDSQYIFRGEIKEFLVKSTAFTIPLPSAPTIHSLTGKVSIDIKIFSVKANSVIVEKNVICEHADYKTTFEEPLFQFVGITGQEGLNDRLKLVLNVCLLEVFQKTLNDPEITNIICK